MTRGRASSTRPVAQEGDLEARLHARFVELEVRWAYQDKLLADLSGVLHAQEQELEALRRKVRELEAELRKASDEAAGPVPVERPPHY